MTDCSQENKRAEDRPAPGPVGIHRRSDFRLETGIVVVSGLPRSGTSMMMQMLEAGGLPVLTDGRRQPDQDNPRGYYEYELTKLLPQDRSWLFQAQGRAVKIVAPLLGSLDFGYSYRIIFLRRNLKEIIKSQNQMLTRLGRDRSLALDERLIRAYQAQMTRINNWLSVSPVEVLDIEYHEAILRPAETAAEVNTFLGGRLDERAMRSVIDPSLYRQRIK